jgi:hypothetical protein
MFAASIKAYAIAMLALITAEASAQSAPSAAQPFTPVSATPLSRIEESNILYKKRVWRDLDPLKPEQADDYPYGSTLGAILIDGALNGKMKVYSAADDRFTTELSHQDLATLLATHEKELAAQKSFRYKIKEDWLFLKKENEMVVRIVGLAPVKAISQSDSLKDQPLFWVYYPDCRDLLAEHKIPNSENKTWYQFFESREFKSKITQVRASRGDTTFVTD